MRDPQVLHDDIAESVYLLKVKELEDSFPFVDFV